MANAVPHTIDQYPACTTPSANDVLLGKGNAIANTFKYTINVLANTFIPSNRLVLANSYINVVNANTYIVFGGSNADVSASPAIVTYLSSPVVGMIQINGSPIQTRANTEFNSINKASLPAANTTIVGQIVYVPDDTGGPCLAVCNGSAWCKLTLGAAVS
jgi:hypothetical protein